MEARKRRKAHEKGLEYRRSVSRIVAIVPRSGAIGVGYTNDCQTRFCISSDVPSLYLRGLPPDRQQDGWG